MTRYCSERKPLSSVLMDTLEDWLRAFTDDFRRFKRYLKTKQQRGVVGAHTPCLGEVGKVGVINTCLEVGGAGVEVQTHAWGEVGELGSTNTCLGGTWEF